MTFIKRTYNIQMIIIARNKGKSSIQIDGLSKFLSNSTFLNIKSLTKKYPKIKVGEKNNHDKSKYIEVFSVGYTAETPDERIHNFLVKLRKTKRSNMDELIEYLIKNKSVQL